MINRLRRKFVLINLIMVTGVMLVAFYCNCVFTKAKMYNDSIETLKAAIETGSTTNTNTFIVSVDKYGSLYLPPTHNNAETKALVLIAINSEKDVGELKSQEYRFLKKEVPLGTTIAFTNTSEEKAALENMISFSAYITLCCALPLLCLSIYLSRIVTKPVADSLETKKQLIADASHELKTPITAIISSADVLLSDHTINEDCANWIENIKYSAEDMSTLVNDMLSLANSEKDNQTLEMETINLSDLVTAVSLNFEAVFFEHKKNFSSYTDDQIYIYGNGNSLKQLVKIFLNNADKYSDVGGTITIDLKSDEERATLTVYNSGQPIPADELPRIFDRFYRVDKVRTTASGSGLGLAIAKRIAEQHSTRIAVYSDENGTVFSVQFKKVD